ncbi:hypothetical protein [Frigoriglobus tundricola]|uniref:Uncharacterized protein n=1 Tax=Frigoriglobus tundricola TaxID=2774151 RepID=A0A6M5YUP0_9BACT|nr:hypothetical protein [Frigoriglobus tundricola]QJW97013.1 hypothetical protein FTUN_4573 [Frigoriglobus tundricola]
MSATRLITLAALGVAVTVGGGVALWARPTPGDPPAAPEKPAPAPAKAKELAVDVAWGKEVNGLQAGVGFAPGRKGPYRLGDTATFVILLRNVSSPAVTFDYTDYYLYHHRPAVVNAAGKPVPVSQAPPLAGEYEPKKLTLATGEVVELGRTEQILAPARDTEPEKPTLYVGPGRYKVSFSGIPPYDKPAPAARLSTGQIDLEVVVETLTPVFGQDDWRFEATYWNTTGAVVDLRKLLRESSIVLDGKTYPRRLMDFGGYFKMPRGVMVARRSRGRGVPQTGLCPRGRETHVDAQVRGTGVRAGGVRVAKVTGLLHLIVCEPLGSWFESRSGSFWSQLEPMMAAESRVH